MKSLFSMKDKVIKRSNSFPGVVGLSIIADECMCSGNVVRMKRRRGLFSKRAVVFVAAAASVMLTGVAAEAAKVDALISRLHKHESYQVRVTAALVLGKSCDSRAYYALVQSLETDEHPVVRSTAASSLASMGLLKAADVLRKASKDKDPVARKGAARALASLCRGETRGKDLYINLDRITYKGPEEGRIAIDVTRCRFGREFQKESGFLLAWKGCGKPSPKQLGRQRIAGYFVDVVVQVRMFGDVLGCRITPTIFTYPRGQLRTTGGGSTAKVPGKMDPGTIDTCIKHSIDAQAEGLIQTLRRL